MRVALVNPPWAFEGSIYFGCREAHLPLELGYAAALLTAAGHEAEIFDGALSGARADEVPDLVAAWGPDMTVVTTAPTYLFWRCPPPELQAPGRFLRALGRRGGRTVAVGPHGSSTPGAALRKLGVDLVIRGECEEAVATLAATGDRRATPGAAWLDGDGAAVLNGPPQACRFSDLAPLAWPDAWVRRKRHHHHRFDGGERGFGAEVEASRGCPYACTFCAKLDFRDRYRRRDLDLILAEIDGLIAQGVGYLYFIDEIFLPQEALLEALAERDVAFGVQTRIDIWKPAQIALLGRAGCVSVEAGVESLTVEGRAALAKRCRIDTERLSDLLIETRRHVPFVQANLIESEGDDPALVVAWRDRLRAAGVWANDPVPLYPYPASPQYRALWGAPDDRAWERAHDHYLAAFARFSDIQDQRPRDLATLEAE
jgi:B12-binding domain/radical SAM domain protein of rhizo-twelve system